MTIQECEAADVEVLVADNGSDPSWVAELLASFPSIQWIRTPGNVGFGAACNLAADRAHGELLLFLNPDAALTPQTLAALGRAFRKPALHDSIVGCSIANPDGSPQMSCRRFPQWRTALFGTQSILGRWFPQSGAVREYLMADMDRTLPVRVDWVSGAAMAMRRAIFDRLGGFDRRYFLYCEDVDICKRAASAGISTWYYPDARVTHCIGGSSRSAPIRALFHRHLSLWKYYRAHMRAPLLDPLVAVLLACRLTLHVCLTRRYATDPSAHA